MTACDLEDLAATLPLADFLTLCRLVVGRAYPGMTRATVVVDVAGSKAGVVLPVLGPPDEAVSR